MISILKARSIVNKNHQKWQFLQVIGMLLLPYLLAIYAIYDRDATPYVVSVAVIITIFDALVVERVLVGLTRRAAVLGDHFDTELFELPWNSASAGAPCQPEGIAQAAHDWKGDEAELKDRYPAEVARAPFHVARVLCQASGVWFDAELRRGFRALLILLGGVMLVALTGFGIASRLTVTDWMLSAWAPMTPIMIWMIRQHHRLSDATEANTRITSAIEELLRKVNDPTPDADQWVSETRNIQTAIFDRRAQNTWVPRWWFRRERPRLAEAQKEGLIQRLEVLNF
jgi:hypothetical protein